MHCFPLKHCFYEDLNKLIIKKNQYIRTIKRRIKYPGGKWIYQKTAMKYNHYIETYNLVQSILAAKVKQTNKQTPQHNSLILHNSYYLRKKSIPFYQKIDIFSSSKFCSGCWQFRKFRPLTLAKPLQLIRIRGSKCQH